MARETANQGVGLLTAAVLARLLTPYDFGVGAAAVFFSNLAARLMRFGFNTALMRLKVVSPAHAATLFILNMATAVVLCGTLTALAPLAGSLLKNPDAGRVLPLVAVTFVIGALSSVPAALMSRDLLFKQQITANWISTVVNSGSTVVFAVMGLHFWSLALGQVLGSISYTVALFTMSPWRPSFTYSRSAARDLLSFGVAIYFRQLLDYFALNIDNLVVGRLLGLEALGLYDKAFGTMNRVVDRASLGASAAFRVFAVIVAEPERFRRGYRKTIMTVTLVGWPILAVLAAAAPGLFYVLFGPQWMGGVVPFQILCAGGALKLLNTYNSAALQAAGLIWVDVRRQGTYGVLILGGVALGARWGVIGVSAAVLVATFAVTLMIALALMRSTPLRVPDVVRTCFPALACAVGAVAVSGGVGIVLARVSADAGPAARLLAQLTGAVAWIVVFTLAVPLPEVRQLVWETCDDLLPRRLSARLAWVLKPGATLQA